MKKRKLWKSIAENRIKRLFALAERYALDDRLDLADRYVFLARKISMRYLVPVPREFKRRFCKHCYCYLLPDVTCRVRIHRNRIIVYCHGCKKFMRMPLKGRV
jgi:ribonuclease P protein subunit RPR2